MSGSAATIPAEIDGDVQRCSLKLSDRIDDIPNHPSGERKDERDIRNKERPVLDRMSGSQNSLDHPSVTASRRSLA
jgi:hypothetical protein